MIKDATNFTIKRIFEDFYQIPEYQREYSWGRKHWENLFDDLNESNEGYFLGSSICIDTRDNGYYEVVDGQQRLATLTILKLAICDCIKEYNKKKILNVKVEKEKVKEWLNLEDSLFKNKPRLILQNKQNIDDYKFLLQECGFPNGVKINEPKNYGNRRIKLAYNYFYNSIEKDTEFDIDDIFKLLEKINSAELVRIVTENAQGAFVLFESINNRGLPLSPVDLIKNKLFSELPQDELKSYNEEWGEISDINITEFKDQVRFLRQFYNAFKEKNILGDEEVFYKIPKIPKATKTNIITIFEKWIGRDNEDNAKRIFETIIEYSKYYSFLVAPNESLKESVKYFNLQSRFEDLLHLGVAPSYALFLYLIKIDISEIEMKKIIILIEKWFIRRHLTNNPSTGKLDQIFMDLIDDIHKDKTVIVETIKNTLYSKEILNQQSNIEKALYGKLYEENKSLSKYLLIFLERSYKKEITRESGRLTNFWKVLDFTKKKQQPIWTVEHILPQNPKKISEWKEWFSDEEHKEYMDKLGNLTLTGYNSNLSNRSFKDKKEKTIKTDEEYQLIGYNSGVLGLNEYVKNQDMWMPEQIDERTALLNNKLIKLLTV